MLLDLFFVNPVQFYPKYLQDVFINFIFNFKGIQHL